MSEKTEIITHPGIIKQLFEKKVEVMILSQSACSSCHAKGACSAADMEEKIVLVDRNPESNYTVGQQVTVFMREQLGTLAVFFGYILPFLLVILTLIIMIVSDFSEGIAGLTALIILIPYYLVLYSLRNKMSKTFQFGIK